MRVVVDGGAAAVRLELHAAAGARRVAVADGLDVVVDAAGCIVEIELRGVDPAALQAVTVEMAGAVSQTAATASSGSRPGAQAAGSPSPEAPPPKPLPPGSLSGDAPSRAPQAEPSAAGPSPLGTSGFASSPAGPAPAGSVSPAAPARNGGPAAPPRRHDGPLTWDPEAEAAILQVPFFSRGQRRLEACALARRAGSDRVTLDHVQGAGGVTSR